MGETIKKALSDIFIPAKEISVDQDMLNAYRQYIIDSIAKGKPITIPNSGPDHASIMMSEFFNISNSEIKMVVGDFGGAVSNKVDYLESLRGCISRKVRFDVIILDPFDENGSAVSLLKKYQKETINPANGKSEKVEISHGNMKTKKFFEENNTHFSIFDNKNFRLEVDPISFVAIGGIQTLEMTKKLIGLFDIYKHLATADS